MFIFVITRSCLFTEVLVIFVFVLVLLMCIRRVVTIVFVFNNLIFVDKLNHNDARQEHP